MAKVALLGRTSILIHTARALQQAGHAIVLVGTNPQGEDRADYDIPETDFEEFAQSLGIPLLKTNRLREEHLATIRSCGADVGISVNWKTVISSAFLEPFPWGVLNAHGGDLPRYRGNACQAWAILNRESSVALCVHRMVGGMLDAGDIIRRERLGIDVDTTVTDIFQWIEARAPTLFVQAVDSLAADPSYVLERQSALPEHSLRCYPRRPEDGRIVWSMDAESVVRLIHASARPYAGAFFFLQGRKVVVWKAQLVSDSAPFCAVPGQVTAVSDDYLEVATGAGKVRLVALELDGAVVSPPALTASIRDRVQ